MTLYNNFLLKRGVGLFSRVGLFTVRICTYLGIRHPGGVLLIHKQVQGNRPMHGYGMQQTPLVVETSRISAPFVRARSVRGGTTKTLHN